MSALANVVAIRVRSRVPDPAAPGADAAEIDYVAALNGSLPPDVWVTGWAPVPDGFSARFSAAERAYRYFWVEDGPLDVAAMKAAAAALVGTHDFRHLCKPDIPAVTNFVRKMTTVEVDAFDVGGGGAGGDDAEQRDAPPSASAVPSPPRRYTGVVLTVAGNAFLWHQVRCVAALLLMVGRGFEAPAAVTSLLDVAATPRRPQYMPAPPHPLLLTGASFPGLVWRRSRSGIDDARSGVRALLRDALSRTALLAAAAAELDGVAGGGEPPLPAERTRRHVPLSRRPTDPPVEERLAAKGKTIDTGPPRRPAAAAAGPVACKGGGGG